MDTTASAAGTSSSDVPSNRITPDQKLVCLGSWLERTTLKEAQSAQACSLLPATTLTIGTAFAGTFVSIDQRWMALVIFAVFVFGALSLFLYHHRRWTIWRAVAVRLQTEQRCMIGKERHKAWEKAGCYPPEKLAQALDKQEPLRPFSGPALALYLAAVLLGMMLLAFAIEKDYHWLQPKPTAAVEPWGSGNTGPNTRDRRPVF
ncbi:MAG: hypothetical protein ACR2RE_14820 [Geminicoccaceae bacterium]